MTLSLNQAVKTGKIAKTTLQRALDNGDISATKNNRGHWVIDESEFGRWLSSRSAEHSKTSNENRRGTPEKTTDKTSDLKAEIKLLQERVAGKETEVRRLENERDDLRLRLDSESEERRKLTALLTDQRQTENRGFWSRLFGGSRA